MSAPSIPQPSMRIGATNPPIAIVAPAPLIEQTEDGDPGGVRRRPLQEREAGDVEEGVARADGDHQGDRDRRRNDQPEDRDRQTPARERGAEPRRDARPTGERDRTDSADSPPRPTPRSAAPAPESPIPSSSMAATTVRTISAARTKVCSQNPVRISAGLVQQARPDAGSELLANRGDCPGRVGGTCMPAIEATASA